ncbi:hypothetical protein ACXWQ3_09290, partial [Streptococcus pyogenes]
VQIDRTENFIANGLVSHNTRWHEDDLAGRLIQHDLRQTPENRLWRVVNIPAVAEEGVPDALGRQPGEALVSARGRSRRDFETIRRSVGERVWTALYQGVPTPTTGGLFAAEDLNKHRCQSSDIIGRVVSVDPSDSGTGDEAGILIMGWDDYGNVIVE